MEPRLRSILLKPPLSCWPAQAARPAAGGTEPREGTGPVSFPCLPGLEDARGAFPPSNIHFKDFSLYFCLKD